MEVWPSCRPLCIILVLFLATRPFRLTCGSGLHNSTKGQSILGTGRSPMWRRTVSAIEARYLEGIAPLLGYEFVTPEHQILMGLCHYGSSARLRKFVSNLMDPTTVTPLRLEVIGGSHSWTAGGVTAGVDDWFSLFKDWLATALKVPVASRNGCVPATAPGYLALCMDDVVDPNVDLVFVEYTPNIEIDNRVSENTAVKDTERILQHLLALPGRPAVVLVHAPHVHPLATDRFYSTSEDLQGALATYYAVPAISARPAQLAMRMALSVAGTTAEAGRAHRGSHAQLVQVKQGSLHQTLLDLAVYLIQTAALDLVSFPVTPEEEEFLSRPVPAPMYADVAPPAFSACLRADSLKAAVTQAPPGWTWVNAGLDILPRWGFLADTPLSKLRLPLTAYTAGLAATASAEATKVSVVVHFLRSHYPAMGVVQLQCTGACFCRPRTVDAWTSVRTAQVSVDWVTVVPLSDGPCDLVVSVLNNTVSGGHKFMVTGVGVSAPKSPTPVSGSNGSGASSGSGSSRHLLLRKRRSVSVARTTNR